MKRLLLGLLAAIAVHAVVLLFGGIFFMHDPVKKDERKVLDIEPLTEEKQKQEPETKVVEEPVEETPEKPPDMTEVVKMQEQLSAAMAAPALDAVSLSALEGALSGSSGRGDFAIGANLASGGRIGGTGASGGEGEDGALGEGIFSLSELDQQPRAIFQATPIYPIEMRQKKQPGEVYLLFVVDAQGRVQNPRVEKSSDSAFEKPALEAVRQWKFEPAIRNGRKVATKLRIPIRFSQS